MAEIKPDVLLLQEVVATKLVTFPPPPRQEPGDYEVLFYLIDRLRDATSEDYRVALMHTDPRAQRTGLNPEWSGRAVLYKSSTIVNASRPVGPLVAWDQMSPFGPHRRANYPCTDTGVTGQSDCTLVDDATAWAVGYEGNSDEGWALGASFVSLELKDHPGRPFHVFDFHRQFRKGDPDELNNPQRDVPALLDLVQRTGHDPQFMFPPIVGGDFNYDVERMRTEGRFPAFDLTDPAFPKNDVVGIIVGRTEDFPTQSTYTIVRKMELPLGMKSPDGVLDPDRLWSDHYGVFLELQAEL